MITKLLVETAVIWILFFIYVWLCTVPMGPVGGAFYYAQDIWAGSPWHSRWQVSSGLALGSCSEVSRFHKVLGRDDLVALSA